MNSLMKFTINAFIYFLILNFGLCFNVVQSTVHLKFNNYGNRKLSCASFQFQCKNEQQIEGNFFQCDNGACIDKLHKCDGIEQCCDGSDEWAQNCETNSLENRKKRATSGNCEPIPSSHNQTIIYECDNGTSQTCIINGLISEKTVAKVVCNKSHSAEKEIGFESICFRNKWYPDVRKCDDTEKTPQGCETNKDCHSTLACVGYKCVNPCPDICGAAAICVTSNHLPICRCPPGFSGDPFIQCTPMTLLPEKLPSENPCYPSPCGPFSQCQVIDQQAACSCLPEYLGTPPNCRPECVVSSECTRDRACIKEKCVDPCLNTCGLHALCNVINHSPICSCQHQYTGDPFSQCLPIDGPDPLADTQKTQVEPLNPCHSNPCGANAECFNKSEVATCQCINGYYGDPYSGCKRECESSKDCDSKLACKGYKCVDPCPYSCHPAAVCLTSNHLPFCFCHPGYTGDPYIECTPAILPHK